MNALAVNKIFLFFHSYGLKYERELIEEWINNDLRKGTDASHQISEDYIYWFNDWLRWKGTAYEAGIDDQTKINRLHEEICALKKEIENLQREKEALEEQLGIPPF